MANRPDEASSPESREADPLNEHGDQTIPPKAAPPAENPPKGEASPPGSSIPVPAPAPGTVARSEEPVPPADTKEPSSPGVSKESVPASEAKPESIPYGGEVGSVTSETEPGTREYEGDSYHHGTDDYYHDDYHHGEHEHHGEESHTASTALVPAGSGRGGSGGTGDDESNHGDDDQGGPVKSFLDHLEDLRWMLIKCVSVIGVAMLVCLLAGNWITATLMLPLKRAEALRDGLTKPTNSIVNVNLGTNAFGPFRVGSNVLGSLVITNERFLTLDVEMVTVGTNHLLGVKSRVTPVSERRTSTDVNTYGPADGFIIAFKVAMYAGVFVSSPLLLWFIGQFVFPALKVNEKKFIGRAIFIGAGLFLTGVAFCYFILMPFALNASVMYSQWLGFGANQWRADEYISFVCKFMLGMGLGFELPVVLLTLVKIGILDYAMLKKLRPYMIVINLVLGALLTTPEVFTQVLMAVPLQILFEVSLLITWYWERKQKKREAAAAAGSA